jgi:hypothetical protein
MNKPSSKSSACNFNYTEEDMLQRETFKAKLIPPYGEYETPYGKFVVDEKLVGALLANVGMYGTMWVTYEFSHGIPAAGEIIALEKQPDGSVDATIQWHGRYITNAPNPYQFKGIALEMFSSYTTPDGKEVGPIIIGAALTNSPTFPQCIILPEEQ